MAREMLINVAETEECRVAVVENGSLEELERLTDSAGGVALAQFQTRVRRPNAATLISRAKIAEIQSLIDQTTPDCVVFDVELSPAQQRNLEERLERKVLTRTEVILDIFARHAHSREGKLQVELAQLQYRLSRLTGRGVLLSRLGGGIGNCQHLCISPYQGV